MKSRYFYSYLIAALIELKLCGKKIPMALTMILKNQNVKTSSSTCIQGIWKGRKGNVLLKQCLIKESWDTFMPIYCCKLGCMSQTIHSTFFISIQIIYDLEIEKVVKQFCLASFQTLGKVHFWFTIEYSKSKLNYTYNEEPQ